MQREYQRLLTISFSHTFFADQQCEVLELIPTASCRQWMRTFDLRLVRRASAYELFYGRSGQQSPAIEGLSDLLPLSFIIRVADARFLNYTELPFADLRHSLYYFSNTATPAGGPLSDQSSVSGADQAAVQSPVLVYTFPADHPHYELPAAAQLELQDELGEVLATYPATGSPDEAGLPVLIRPLSDERATFEIDLRSLPAGRYTLLPAGADALEFVNFHDGLRIGDFGLLTLYVDAANPLDPSPVYHLKFERRSTRWRYYLMNVRQSEYSGFSILGQDEPVFQQVEEADPSELFREAVVFVSDRDIPLQEVADEQHQYTLKLDRPLKGNGRLISTKVRLPSADPGRINKARTGQDEQEPIYYSDMYVYL